MSGTRIAVLQGFVVAALLTVAVAELELAVGAIDLDVAFALDFAADYFGGEFVYELLIIIKILLYL
jgi:hypothetical protein